MQPQEAGEKVSALAAYIFLEIPKELEAKKALQQNGLAELYTRMPISNGFCIQSDLLSSKADGCFEIDFFQGHGHTAD